MQPFPDPIDATRKICGLASEKLNFKSVKVSSLEGK